MRARIKEDWILLYIERWLVALFDTDIHLCQLPGLGTNGSRNNLLRKGRLERQPRSTPVPAIWKPPAWKISALS
jgi:hypothetical protein